MARTFKDQRKFQAKQIVRSAIVEQALQWHMEGCDLQTIADHFKISKDKLRTMMKIAA
jgi:hypothetical protein